MYFQNPITDLVSHLFYDLQDKKVGISGEEHSELLFEQRKEFGNIAASLSLYDECFTDLSPYHLSLKRGRPITDLLVCVDEENDYVYHSRKLVAKLRDIYAEDPLYMFYRQFPPK